eukprot:1146672-Pelagomonas_calceolata.AAC.1
MTLPCVKDGRLSFPEGNFVSRYGCHGKGIETSPSSFLLQLSCPLQAGVDEYAVVWPDLEVLGVLSELL